MAADPTTIDPAEILMEPGTATHPQAAYAKLRDRCPVGRSQMGGMSMVYISRYEDVTWALRHPEYFSSEGDPMALSEQPMIPLQVDPPRHTKYRRLVSPPFSLREIKRLEPDLRALARQRVEAIAGAGHCDFHEELATPLPTSFFLALMGLPLDDLPMFLRWRDETIRPDVEPGDFEGAAQSRKKVAEAINEYFKAAIAERRAQPAPGLLSDLLTATIDGELLDEPELLGFSHLLLLAGLDTVTASLDCLFAHLATHPELRQRLVADPTLVPGAVEELMRWETPVTMILRSVKQPLELCGVALQEGEQVALVLGAANQDEEEFGAPAVVPDRRPNRHVAFGSGNHFCLGAQLARAELRIAIEELHARIPDYRLAGGHRPHFSPGIRQASSLELEWET